MMSGAGTRATIVQRRGQIIPRKVGFDAVIVATATDVPGRWVYHVGKVRPTATATEAGQPDPDPRWEAIGGPTLTAYNRVEMNNTASSAGVQGYGIDLDSPSLTVELLPIRVPSIVFVSEAKTTVGVPHYWFTADNPLEVSCQ